MAWQLPQSRVLSLYKLCMKLHGVFECSIVRDDVMRILVVSVAARDDETLAL